MIRTSGSFRPQLEAIEDRNAPGSLLGTDPGPDLSFLPVIPAALPQGSTTSTSPVVDFPTRSIVFGESTLIRTEHGVTMHLKAEGLPAGVYTFWIPIFAPGGTSPIAAGRVAGHVVGEGGNLNFTAHLKEGEIISGHPVFPSGAIQDAQTQDIGMVVRYHGPAQPGRIYEQTHTYDAAGATDFLFSIHRSS